MFYECFLKHLPSLLKQLFSELMIIFHEAEQWLQDVHKL